MAHTYTYLATHIVFSTKDRLPLITAEIKSKLWAYMNGVIGNIGGRTIAISGMADHTHLLMLLPPSVAISDAMRTLKANSSKWIHETWPEQPKFAWQNGYAAFSVSRSSIQDVLSYVQNQEQHHRKFSFQEELLGYWKNTRLIMTSATFGVDSRRALQVSPLRGWGGCGRLTAGLTPWATSVPPPPGVAQ